MITNTPLKGKYLGNCNVVACQKDISKEENWYNSVMGAYYCEEHAHRINQACYEFGGKPLCEVVDEAFKLSRGLSD